ncbi:amino acid adenylation domain-containing protein [Clostridium sp. UBA6640]|uniref:amino acid adenylation domain-containing protein n=1 Tax=Clostridium sp. UBA6640 TaxID=1946370 RepID=UPI0025C6AF86|nr:non-ribosomal peptide synthetase [Clostridium sp. UBA6640]
MAKNKIKDILKMTPTQQGMFFYWLLGKDNDENSYCYQEVFKAKGNIDIELLQESFNYLVEYHDVFRTIFKFQDGEKPLQIILNERNFKMGFKEISKLENKYDYIEKEAKKNRKKGFDLIKDIPIKVDVYKVDENEYRMVWTYHHIIIDGWSLSIIYKDLLHIYNLLVNHEKIELEPIVEYKNYIEWLRNKERYKQQGLEYWRNYLKGYEQQEIFTNNKKKILTESYKYEEYEFNLSSDIIEKLNKLAKTNKVSTNIVFQVLWGIFLQKYSNVNDVVYGTVVSGRPSEIDGIERMVGLFINTIPMRIKSEKEDTLEILLRKVNQDAICSKEYEHMALIDIQKQTSQKNKLINHIVVFENFVVQDEIKKINDKVSSTIEVELEKGYEQTNYDLNFLIYPTENYKLMFTFNSEVYDKEFIENISKTFSFIATKLIENPNAKLKEIDIVSDEEKHKLLYEFNDTGADYPRNKTLHKLFEEQVEKTPNNIAIMYENEEITYKDLNSRANSLAHVLKDKGIKANNIVAISVERSVEMIVGIFAILKSGAAYLPIDSSYPEERIEYILEDSKPAIVLVEDKVVSKISYESEIININDDSIYLNDINNLGEISCSEDLAYIIYTSGTTANPKGVMIKHGSAVNRLNWMKKKYEINEKDTILQKTTYTFDVSVWELFLWTLAGAKLKLLTKGGEKDPSKIVENIKDGEVTIIHFVPSMLSIFNEYVLNENKYEDIATIRFVVSSGEALKKEYCNVFNKTIRQNNYTRLVNLYGPTEATVDVTYYECKSQEYDEAIPIGKPIDNTQLYILDKNLKLVPIGVSGELYIGGVGVSTGYINNLKLTKEKFIDNPYDLNKKIYKTGDLARWLPDGNIEFLGRIDHQVKIRGFRIELEEIESVLLKLEGLKKVVVLDKEENNERYLCAYYEGKNDFTIEEFRKYLETKLPYYMIPSSFVKVSNIPLTENNKVDRKALLNLTTDINIGTEYKVATNDMERNLIRIWEQVLLKDKIGINDNFFSLGGDSIKSIRLVSLINKELNVNIKINSIYKNLTIKKLVEYMEKNKVMSLNDKYIEEARLEIEKLQNEILNDEVEKSKLPKDFEEFYPMSDIELGMIYYMFKSAEEEIYHDQFIYEIEEENFNYELLKKAMENIVLKHSNLRTSFNIGDFSEPLRIVHSSINLNMEMIYIKSHNKDKRNFVDEYMKNDRKIRFDISKAPIWRMKVFNFSNEKVLIGFFVHHSILDGFSVASLMAETASIYKQLKNKEEVAFNKLRCSYKESIIEQKAIKNNPKIKRYWKKELDEYEKLPLIYKDNIDEYDTYEVEAYLNEEVFINIKEIATKYNTNIKSVCFAAYSYMINMLTYKNDIVVGLVGNNRPICEDGDKLLGCFLNTIPVRIKFEKEMTWEDLLNHVNKKMIDLTINGRLPLAEIAKVIGENTHDGNKIFDTFFNFIDFYIYNNNDFKYKVDIKKNNMKSVFGKTNTPLDFTASIINNKIYLNLRSSNKIFTQEESNNLMSYFINIINEFITNIKGTINKENILTKEEREKVIFKFNDTEIDYPRDKTLYELFEAQVEKTPNNIAVVFEDKKLTYKELNEKSNSLARVLRKKGVKANSIVAIMMERSLEMIVGLIGILKSGGAYLPIDSSYPKERIEYMLEDSESKILLSDKKLIGGLVFEGEIIDIFNESLFSNDESTLEKINNSNDLAYVIYTSGTTGRSKGVMIKHNSVVNYTKSIIDKAVLTSSDETALLSSYAFDLGYTTVFTALITGIKLNIISEDKYKNPQKLVELLKENITYIKMTPSLFSIIANYQYDKPISNNKLRLIILGGEEINIEDIKVFTESNNGNNAIIMNHYGPTETTIGCITTQINLSKLNEFKRIIGKPLNNVNAYILDKYNKVCGIGTEGELYISGEGLSVGYLNRPELTAEKFIDNPFNHGTNMYKTGDLARWLPDGNIEFLGRIDDQVKVRGFRIELGEIENKILQHEEVKEATVAIKEYKNNEKYICAYVVSEKEINELNLRSHLKESLPDYMIPSYFIKLDKMPLTYNGKLDGRALPDPTLDVDLSEYEAPRNEIEEILAKLWSQILGMDKVGINDNFFQLGGHSLKAMVLISKIHKKLNREVSLKELFKYPTIKGLSNFIKNAEENQYFKIDKIEEKDYYEVSSAQKRMYLLQQINLESISYNMPGILEIKGNLDVLKLENIFKTLIERHETLRTKFIVKDEEIVQVVQKNPKFNIEYLDNKKNLDDCINKFIRPFDLNKDNLLRVGLIKVKELTHILIFDMHHIISDGMSREILINEFIALYKGEVLENLRIQYKDFAKWQNDLLKAEEFKKKETYWVERFSDEIPILNMPTDFTRPAIQSFDGDSICFRLDKNIAKELRNIANKTESTMYMVLLAAVNIFLYKYSSQEDIVIGSPIAGRKHEDLENVLGVFVNTLAMRNYPCGNKTFESFLSEVRNNALEAYENQDFQFDMLIDKLNLSRDISRNPLFDVMFSFESKSSESIVLNDMAISEYDNNNKISKFDLSISAFEMDDALEFEFEYCTKLFRKESIERMTIHFSNILKQIIKNEEIKLKEIDILSEEEKNTIITQFNNTGMEFNENKVVHQLFEEQVEKTPDNVAIMCKGITITYGELNKRANQLARKLRDESVGRNSIVGIMMDRSIEMVIAIIGVLKAGGAYLPVDTEYPLERVKYMLDDSAAKVLLVKSSEVNKNIMDIVNTIIDIEDEEIYIKESYNLEWISNKDDLAYVIYTSGSTGNPKGAMIEHLGMLNHILAKIKDVELNDKSIVSQNSSHCFDISVWQFLASLVVGGKIVIYTKYEVLNAEEFIEHIEKDKVSVLEVVPSYLETMLYHLTENNKLADLKHLLVTGEVLKKNLVNRWFNKYKHVKMVNAYGPTEASDDITHYIMDKPCENDIVTIGKPIANLKIYIVDEQFNILPVGIPGELCVSGIGVGRGYINNYNKTTEVFMEDPFIDKGVRRLYKTGDLAKWLPDGNIEILGRKDYQVKIRGFRIELGEIENILLKHEKINEAVVVTREDSERNKYLCAYVVLNENITLDQLKEELRKDLPEYMIPAYFVKLEKMPLTRNGKIDRRNLPEISNLLDLRVRYEAPRNEVEDKLIKIWMEMLDVKTIGINDNFFDLGGQSLKATILMSKIHKVFNVEVSLRDIFKLATVKELAQYILKCEKKKYIEIKKVGLQDYYEASSAQKRLYLIQKLDLTSMAYNMPMTIEIKGSLNISRVEQVLNHLVERHEVFRTSFKEVNEEIVQVISDKIKFKLDYLEVDRDIDIVNVIESLKKPFNLNNAPLLRCSLIKIEKERHILFCDIHHIIFDGVSMEILTREFIELYDGKELKNNRIQYKDFAKWQNDFFKSFEMEKQEKYWIDKFADNIPETNLPTDFVRQTVQSFEGNSLTFKLDKDISRDLYNMVKETGSTMYMILLSAANILISKYSGQEDIVIGAPIAGRNHMEIENVIGLFVNILVMRNNVDNQQSYGEFLQKVKDNALEAYENQDYQFEKLVKNLNINRDLSRNPLFDVLFNFEEIDNKNIKANGISISEYYNEYKVSKFDLSIFGYEENDEILFTFQYCTQLFKKDTIERMIVHFNNILKEITRSKNIKLKEIEIICKEEKEEIAKYNDTDINYENNKTIQELFEEQVEKTPDNIAVIYDENKINYRELNNRSNQLARLLIDNEVNPGDVVGIMLDRSMKMAIGMLAILKCGATYVSVDPEYPADRIKYMLNNSNSNVLLTQEQYFGKVSLDCKYINIDNNDLYSYSTENLKCRAISSDIAYIIYTSGSTGKPKGVIITHQSALNTIIDINSKFNLLETDKILALSSLCFDLSVYDFFGALICGASTVIIKDKMNTKEIIQAIEKEKVTIWNTVPALMEVLINSVNYTFVNESLRLVLLSGDSIPLKLPERIKSHFINSEVISLGGATEGSIWSIYYPIKHVDETWKLIPYGMPLANQKIYIMDKYLNLAPIGVPGEICIGGVGVAKGYANDIGKTSSRFIHHQEFGYIYKTGDRGRFCKEKYVEFLGRIDNQIKIRGFRIELGEVESTLLNIGGIDDVAVLVKESKGSKYICAFITGTVEHNMDEIKALLKEKLPEYMIPSYFIKMDKLPLTSNGKVDKKQLLLSIDERSIGVKYEEARNELEEAMIDVWQKVLYIDRIGINNNFFDLGGHSLNAATIINEIHNKLNVELEIKDIFQRPTIRELSELVLKAKRNEYKDIEKVEKQEYYETSSAQKRMYLAQQLDLKSATYNMPVVLEVEGNLNIERLKETLKYLVNRHEALRTEFLITNKEIVQKINENVEVNIQYFDMKNKNLTNIMNEFIKPFNLNRSPNFRVGIVKIEEVKYYILIDMHHIISDGISFEIISREFVQVYSGKQLEPLKIQYKDFAVWQNKFKATEYYKNQEEYWMKEFSGDIPILNLPTDYVRNHIKDDKGDYVGFYINEEDTKKLKRIARDNESTMFMVILSAFNILLSKYSGQNDIIVSTPIAGRNNKDLENVIGVFINTLAIRSKIDEEITYKNYLLQLKEKSIKAFENQDYQYDELIEKIGVDRSQSREVLTDIMFAMQNIGFVEMEIEELKIKPLNLSSNDAKFDILLSASDEGDSIALGFNYRTSLYKKETIELMAKHFENIISQIKYDVEIKDISIFDKNELLKINRDINKVIKDSTLDIEFNF